MTERFGPLRANDKPMVCYRCGCVFLPMAVWDADEREDDTECPVCDLPRNIEEAKE